MKSKLTGVLFISLALATALISCEEGGYFNPTYPPVPADATTVKSVATLAPLHVTTTSADLRGSVTLAGDGVILERGIYVSDSPNPLMIQPGEGISFVGKKFVGQITDGANFTVSLTELKANTRYKYIAYVTTTGGTSFGEVQNLVTSYGTVTDVEGNEYQTVMIGDQLWMRENLKSTLYKDKSSIGGYYTTENDIVNGKHYTFDAANRSVKGVKSGGDGDACPTGWHVPTDADFQALLKYTGVTANQISLGLCGDNQACQLKDAAFWSNSMIDNSTGFSVIPAGICNPDEGDECIQTAFWTSTPHIFYGFQTESEKIMRLDDEPDCTCGISIRCIKD